MNVGQSLQNGLYAERLDTGLLCLVHIVKLFGIPADITQLQRAYSVNGKGMDTVTILRAAKELGLKAGAVKPGDLQLAKVPLPAIAILKNGNYIVVVSAQEDNYLIIDPYREQPFYLPTQNFINAWSGELILFTRHSSLIQTAKKFNLSWFIPAIWKYKRFLGQILFFSFLLQLFGLVSPMFTQVIIDKVLIHRSLSTLDIMVIGMAGVSVFQVWITALRSYLFTHTTNKIDVVLSAKLFSHITALPIKYFEKWQVGDVVSRVRELENVRQFITGTALTVIVDSIFAVVYIFAMFMYSTTLSLITLLIIPLFIILNVVFAPIYRNRLNEKFAIGTEKQAFLIETVTGIQAIKSFAVEHQMMQKWEQLLARYIRISFSTANLSNVANNLGSFIQQLFMLLILWFGSYQVMQDKLSVGALIAFQMMSGQVVAPILRLVNMWQQLQQTLVSINRLGDILNEETEPAFNPNRTTLPTLCGDVVFDRVSFRYRPGTREVLNQLSIKIEAGTKVGIVGRSGSGKSTLTKMIQRMYLPESGRILIDGVDIAQVEPAWLRRQIGVVLQESFLFNGTIADNIAANRLDASGAEIIKMAVMSGADAFIREMPEGYDTMVGERGTALSGGQKQRIAIARAMMSNPKIVIFDEATSALDFESERIILSNIDKIAKGRTIIMIAHRLSTIKNCDQIIVLDGGRVVEQGTHNSLMEKKGAYFELYMSQIR